MRTRYWIGVVSLEHVEQGVLGGFAQVCHGKVAPLRRMHQGDIFIYYSPKTSMGDGQALQCFTALGKVISTQPYAFQMSPNFIPHRVDIDWHACHHAPIRPLIAQLSFIQDVRRWGYTFRLGHFEISPLDAQLIARSMGVTLNMDNLIQSPSIKQNYSNDEQIQLPF